MSAMHEAECAIVCPSCKKAKFILRRKPTEREGICEHILEKAPGSTQQDHKACRTCGAALERGPLPGGMAHA